eukprot:2032772-Prymnesium_polylepis.2
MYELLETCASWTAVAITLLGGSGITILSVVISGFALLTGRADGATIAPCSALDFHAANSSVDVRSVAITQDAPIVAEVALRVRGDQLRLCIDSGATRGCLPVELGHLIPDELVTNWHPTNVVKSAQGQRTPVQKIGKIPLEVEGFRVEWNGSTRTEVPALGHACLSEMIVVEGLDPHTILGSVRCLR